MSEAKSSGALRGAVVLCALLFAGAAFGRVSLRTIQSDLERASALIEAGRLDEAAALVARAEQGATAARSARALLVARQFEAEIDVKRGRFDLAEPLLQNVIAGIERAFGRNSPALAPSLETLGFALLRQQRLSEAGPLIARALSIVRESEGVNSPQAAELENALAQIYFGAGNYPAAEALFRHAVQVFAAMGAPGLLEAAQANDGLATVYMNEGRKADALAAYQQSLAIETKLKGSDDPETVITENNLAVLERDMGKFDDAEPAFEHVLGVETKYYGAQSATVAQVRNNLGWLELSRHDADKALPLFRESYRIYARDRTVERTAFSATNAPGGVSEYEVGRAILGLLDALMLQSRAHPQEASSLANEAFEAAQAVHRSTAANALAATTARFEAGSDALAGLVRARQDLGRQWAAANARLISLYAGAGTTPSQEASVQAQLGSIETQSKTLDQRIDAAFPRYGILSDPPPQSIAATQAKLRPDEMLVQVVLFGGANGEGAFVFFVGKTTATWRAAPTNAEDVAQLVAALRCGLDSTPWDSPAGAAQCTKLAGPKTAGGPLPFSIVASERLFQLIFGEDAPLIKGKTLLLVLPDPLSTVPFQVLIANDAPANAGPHDVAWLGATNPIAILPSVASLQGLRTPTTLARTAVEPFIGFGDPTLAGNPTCVSSPAPSVCPAPGAAQPPAAALSQIASLARNAQTPPLGQVAQSGGVDLSVLREQCPLPETAFELRCVSQALGAPLTDVHIRDGATVTAVEQAPLDLYRVIHFATHGLLATDSAAVGASAEPALLLTPPQQASASDDGLLTMSEIAQLRLDADWIILSACDTAAGDKGGEALSGLASAFLYAGARAVLASQWPVDSQAAVLLTSRAFAEIAAHPEIGRAEAMRRAMSALIARNDIFAHPSFWAAFTLIGEPGPIAK